MNIIYKFLVSKMSHYHILRTLDSISLLRYVVTTQMQFDFRFSSTAGYCLAAKSYFSYCFSFRVFFQS